MHPAEAYHFLYLLGALLAGYPKSAKQAATSHADLEAFRNILAKSKNLSILLGDDLLRHGGGKDVLRALGNLISLKRDNARASVLLLGYEGNIFAGALAGAHPDILPGFEPVRDRKTLQKWNRNWKTGLDGSRGLSCNEMLDTIGKEGISALLIAGDIPLHPRLSRLKFLVQLNMFKTGLSERADVFLPLTDFLESEGHIMTLEGKIKRTKKIVPGQGKSKTLPAIISLLAREMDASGYFGPSPATLWREFERSIKRRESEASNEVINVHSLKPLSQKGKAEMKLAAENHYDHYRYRGNCLTELVPDLQTVVKWQG